MSSRWAVPMFLLLSLAWGNLAAGSPRGSSPPQAETIERTALQIEGQRRELEQALRREERLLTELAELEENMQERQKHLTSLSKQLARQREILLKKEQELMGTRTVWQQSRQHLEHRLKVLFTRRGTPLLDLALAASSPRDLLAFDEAYHAMLLHDQNVLTSCRATLNEMERSKQALQLEQDVQENFLEEAEREQHELEQQFRGKEKLLHNVRLQAALRQQALAEIEGGWRRMLSSMEQQARPKKPALQQQQQLLQQQRTDMLALQGQLPPPLTGRLVHNSPVEGETNPEAGRQAIVIHAPEGTEARAIAAGTVLFAGYLQGYGNAVVIDHGSDITSTTGHLGRVTTQRGARLQTGDGIGTTSDIANLAIDGVVFELRRAGRLLPARTWLRSGGFSENGP